MMTNKPTFKDYLIEGYYTMPAIDRERYTNREHEGLEGPYQTDTGKVYYYDKKEGKYYDPDTDMFLSYEDVEAMNYDEEKRGKLMQQQHERDVDARRAR